MYKKAFTLAEVLITVGIIGVIAAFTLSVLIQNYQKKSALTQLKKMYSITNQVIQRAENESGTKLSDWPEWDQGSEAVLKTYFLPYLDGAKIYNSGGDFRKAMCLEKEEAFAQYTWLTGVRVSSPLHAMLSSIRLKDGSCIGFSSRHKDSGSYLYLYLDVNGGKNKPNVIGKDLFVFEINTNNKNNKIVPYGYNWKYENLTSESIDNACNKKARAGGRTCSAKIIADNWQMLKDYPW